MEQADPILIEIKQSDLEALVLEHKMKLDLTKKLKLTKELEQNAFNEGFFFGVISTLAIVALNGALYYFFH